MIGTTFAKPLQSDTLTRTVMRTETREEKHMVGYPVERDVVRIEQEPTYKTVVTDDGEKVQVLVGYTDKEVTETVQDVEYREETRTIAVEVPEREEYPNPAPNTHSRYREAAQWCNKNGAIMVDCQPTAEYPNGYYEVQAIPEPTEAEQQKAIKDEYEALVTRWLVDFAATRGYQISNMGAYAHSTNPTFKAEALYYIELQDRTWEKCYEILNAVLAGSRPIPTQEELFAELPVSSAQWPTPNPLAEQAAQM